MSGNPARFRKYTLFAALALVLGLTPAFIVAQPAGPPPGPPGCGMSLEPILSELNLTSQQQTAIDNLLDARREAARGQRDIVKTAQKVLHDRVTADTFDEAAIRAAAAAVASLDADRTVADAALLRDVRQLLTADQRDQLNTLLKKMTPPADRPGPGGPGGPPPGKEGGPAR